MIITAQRRNDENLELRVREENREKAMVSRDTEEVVSLVTKEILGVWEREREREYRKMPKFPN